MHKRTIVIWDIDNTLLYTGGAGSIAMARAFHELYGVEDAFGRVEFSGRSDRAIFRDAAVAHGISPKALDAELARFVEVYVPHLAAALHEVQGSLMPGVSLLLAELDSHPDLVQGLGTGNFRRTGVAKLEHYDIADYFPGAVGGFGDDHESRGELVRIGIERMRNGRRSDRVVVIGDTPHDVKAARANGAYALAVATGRDSVDDLLSCGADAALPNLSDAERALRLILGR